MGLPSATDLNYFLEIAQSLNLSRASERLGVTQPSLTQSLKRLEDSVDVQLFFRSKKGLTLTPAGKKLFQKTSDLMKSWSELKSSTKAVMADLQGLVRLGCHRSVALYTIPDFISRLLADCPQLDFHFEHSLSRKILEQIVRMELDIGLVINPVKHPDLVLIPLLKDEVSLWAAAKANGRLLYDPSLNQSQMLLRKLKGQQKFEHSIESSDLEVLATLAQNGAGTAILPGRVAKKYPGLQKISGSPHFKDELFLVYRSESKAIRAISEVAKIIKESVR